MKLVHFTNFHHSFNLLIAQIYPCCAQIIKIRAIASMYYLQYQIITRFLKAIYEKTSYILVGKVGPILYFKRSLLVHM